MINTRQPRPSPNVQQHRGCCARHDSTPSRLTSSCSDSRVSHPAGKVGSLRLGGPTTGAPRTSCSCFCFEAKTACDLLCPGGKGPSHSSRCCANRGLDIGACAEEADTEFGRRIVGAEPRSCLALRFGRTHRECTVSPPLLNCALCWNREVASTCEPLLVAGRGDRDSSGQPPTTARRSPRRADQEHGGASRAGAGQPAQPGPRRVPRQQRLPHRTTEQTRHPMKP